MATWEIAPGQVRAPDASAPDESEIIALSGPYLSQRTDVRIWDDTDFRVVHMTPGHDLRVDPETHKRRIIAVANGIVHVRIQGGEEFQLGSSGICKISPGMRCVFLNKQYAGAVLHIFTILGYEM
ncbi:hypothetical protein V8F33_012569 [Rhypophila sp. PSN 637]